MTSCESFIFIVSLYIVLILTRTDSSYRKKINTILKVEIFVVFTNSLKVYVKFN